MSKRQGPEAVRRVVWRVFQLFAAVAFGYAGWRLLGHTPYRIDIDVYRMGGRSWLDGLPLYSGDTSFHTQAGADLPFTYPPVSAIVFAPFALLSLPAASATITALTLVLLVVSTVLVLTRLDVCGGDWAGISREPAWARRVWVAIALVAVAALYLEPVRSNFDFGQVNAVLMALVLADTMPRRTPWPRGLLLGVAIALKLTPAVFLVYFALRRDGRAVATALGTFAGVTLIGFVLAWHDSWEYWTTTIRDPDRIGDATLNTNQNISAALARLGLGQGAHFVLWAAACVVVLAVTVWAARRLLRSGGESGPVLALICVAMFGLAVSPVSWSHHWVWVLPTLVVTAVVAERKRDAALAALTLIGVALMVWTPIDLLPQHHESQAGMWRQLAGASYLWWALAVIVVAGARATRPEVSRPRSPGLAPAAGSPANPPAQTPALHPF